MSPRKEVIGDCELWLGDCREILPTLGNVDAVVTDPPYGIGIATNGRSGGGGTSSAKWYSAKPVMYAAQTWDCDTVDDAVAQSIAMARSAVVWGGNYYSLPPASCWLVWDKETNGNLADCELAWTNLPGAVRRIRHLWNGFARKDNEPRDGHPTQKPLGVMKWCIEHLPDNANIVLDPFAGSGTTGVAAVKLGRKFIGIEIEPKYFDIACRRIEAAYKQPDLFIPQPSPKPEQLSLMGDA